MKYAADVIDKYGIIERSDYSELLDGRIVWVKNEKNWITYSKSEDETSFFDIKIMPDKIIVSVPIKNSVYQYVTTFKAYYEASEYIEQKLYDYMNRHCVTSV
jgi:hypothetical protein